MRISVGAGIYVLAVSGGVDSMVLLDLLRKRPGLKLIIAHYDHGIRVDSDLDRKLVQQTAKKYGLPFVHESGKLGPNTSEAGARIARYRFLEKVKKASGAKAIITAHHQDDVLETTIINLMRGSGRLGLTSLKSTHDILRPMLDYGKDQITEYAIKHKISWREDETNSDTKYLRNHIRTNVIPKFTEGQRAQLLILIEGLRATNDELDNHILSLIHVQPALTEIDRKWFIQLPHVVAKEFVHAWLRKHQVGQVNKKTIERLVIAMKTAKIGQNIEVNKTYLISVTKSKLALIPTER